MVLISQSLNAHVQGDEGEHYPTESIASQGGKENISNEKMLQNSYPIYGLILLTIIVMVYFVLKKG